MASAYILLVVEVVYTDEFEAWWDSLEGGEQDSVAAKVNVLAQVGVALGHPHSSAIKGARNALRELRIQHAGRPYRVFYAFDPKRLAVLLIGGDKTGRDRFYEEMVPRADRLFEDYIAEQEQAGEEGR